MYEVGVPYLVSGFDDDCLNYDSRFTLISIDFLLCEMGLLL